MVLALHFSVFKAKGIMKPLFFFLAAIAISSLKAPQSLALVQPQNPVSPSPGHQSPYQNQVWKVTNLGPQGNVELSEKVKKHLQGSKSCIPMNEGPRVILTGFGLFSGVSFNISGAVAENFAQESFLLPSQSSHSKASTNSSAQLKNGRLNEEDQGVRIYNRSLEIDGQAYSICVMILDVLWDFGGALVASEMHRFQPDMVMMMGRGIRDVIFEGGALNSATPYYGYNFSGDPNRHNTPTEREILPLEADELSMTWNNKELKNQVEDLVQSMGYPLSAPSKARFSNDYICNNISYIALSAAQSKPLTLAGGKLKLHPKVDSNPKIGFLHLPANAKINHEEMRGWSELILRTLSYSLN